MSETGDPSLRRMNRRRFTASGAILLLALQFGAGMASGQPIYRVITPDGRVLYTDTPPASGAVDVQPLRVPGLGPAPAGGPAPMPTAPRMDIAPPVAPAPHGATIEALRGTKEMNDVGACTRANQSALALMRASEEVIRSVRGIQAMGARGVSPRQTEVLDRQWKYYKSLGGTAESPEQVRMPDDPCREAKEALQLRSAALEAEYRECIASRAKEMRLVALSKELVSGRSYLAMLEKGQPGNPSAPDVKGGGAQAAALRADPALVRAALITKFREYRSLDGPASRLEDVSEIPNPCLPANSLPSRPSPITEKRTLPLPGR